MKKIFLSLVLVLFTLSVSNAMNEYSYLKIEFNSQKTISYPPGIPFLAKDSQGNKVLSMYDLKKIKEYKIETPIILHVYTSWNEEPDIFKLESGKLSLGITDRTYAKVSKAPKKTVAKNHNATQKNSQFHSNRVYLVGKKHRNYTDKNGYDLRLEFSNDVVFEYENGTVKASQNGRPLLVKNKYIVHTETGKLKISYHPETKKVWWVFEKN